MGSGRRAMFTRDRIWLVFLLLCLMGVLIVASYFDRREKAIRFHMAVSSGNVEEVRMLIEDGIDLEIREGSSTPLMTAALEGQLEVVETLIDAGADPTARVFGGSPLVYWAAARAPSAVFLKVLDAADAFDPNSMVGGESALYARLRIRGRKSVFFRGDDDVPSIKRLLDEGADPNFMGRNGPLLFVALEHRTPEVVRILCQVGADPNVQHSGGHYPLHSAIVIGLEHVKALVENGADPTLKDAQGRTALEAAQNLMETYPSLELTKVIEYLEREQEGRN